MFKQLKPIHPEQDKDLCLQGNQAYHFAATEMLIPIVSSEAAHVAREYAIVFTDTSGQVPFALTGVKQGVNGHVHTSGHWQGRYIPSHIRRYPFVFTDVTKDPDAQERKMVLLADREAEHLNHAGQGSYLFENGKPSEILQKIERVLIQLHQDTERSQYQVRQIEEMGLLMSQPLNIKGRHTGHALELNGLRVINKEKFARLSAEQLHSLHQSGSLTLIHAHFISLTNLSDGWLAHLMDESAPTPAKDVDIESMFGGSDDTLKFNF